MRLLKGDNKTIPTLVVNDHEVTSDSDKVEVLSDHFDKSFNNSLPPSPMDVQSIEIDPNSCPEQLLCTVLGIPVCSVFFDVQKAFDSVPHSILVNKLRSHGLNVFRLR